MFFNSLTFNCCNSFPITSERTLGRRSQSFLFQPTAYLSRRGPGLPLWILCPTAICVRQKIDIFSPIKSIFLSLSVSKSISVSLLVYFRLFFFLFLFFLHIFSFSYSFFFFLLLSVLCPTLSCVRHLGLPVKARKARQLRPCISLLFAASIN